MTRDAEHTPSPQSVVVPVEPTREMWAAGGTAACHAADQHHDKVVEGVWSAMLAAAPPSLAGGEMLAAKDVPAWADGIVTDGEHVAIAQKAEADHGGHYWAVDGGDGGLDWEPTHFISLAALSPEAPAILQPPGVNGGGDGHRSDCAIHNAPALPAGPCDCGSPFLSPEDVKRAHELRADPDSEDNERFASWYGGTLLEVHQRAIQMYAILAALSPEAPARETEGGEVERAARALLEACIADFGDPKDYPDDDGWVASGDSGDSAVTFKHMRDLQAALPPRHEAPAEPVSDRYKFDDEITWLAVAATPGQRRTRRPSRVVVVALDEDGRVCGEVLRTVSGSLNSYREANAAFIAVANPATVLALLSEIAALRGALEEAEKDASSWSRCAGEVVTIGENWKERFVQAERQRDELRKALEDHDQTAAECRIDGARPQRDTTAPCELCGATQRESCGRKGSAAYAFISSARTLLANQGADQ